MRPRPALWAFLTYRLFDFDAMGWDDADLGRVVRMMADVGYSGSNVTFPFKQQVIDHCDELSDQARVLGAVNTLVFRDGKVRREHRLDRLFMAG
jgi:shikimate dehydrogenase